MELTTEQIAFIRNDIAQRGITMPALADSLVDHICCAIETGTETDFTIAYRNAIVAFGENGLHETQQKTFFLLTYKKVIFMKATMYLLAYIAVFLCSTGLLFKMQHWPGASIMFVLGIVILNLGFLPLFFYDKYKRSLA
ncbi:MAG: hypothetical protein F9K23_17470 [Bacteroidetes bacterium]|nr:MAG: hypothetical protein F9K23_17470 [Bacteroidota bacterium]